MLSLWHAALLASGLPVAGLDAPRPKARFAIAAPLAAAIPGEAELVDVWLVERMPRWRVREALQAALPIGHTLVDVYDVWLGEPALPGLVAASVYRAELDAPADAGRLAHAAEILLAADALPRRRAKGEGTVPYDLRPFLLGIEVASRPEGGAWVRMRLRHDPSRGIGRPDETLAALAEVLGNAPLEPAALVREGLVLADSTPPESPLRKAPRRRPAGRTGQG
jgi:hypothetical protein